MSFTPTVLVGPSGVGKGTVLSVLCDKYPQVWVSVSVTTRRPRPGEIDGKHYYFISDSEFDDLIASNGLLEWAQYQTSRYGTPRCDVEEKIGSGRAVIMELEVQGARQVRSKLNPLRTVFLAPPSWEDLEKRLRGRGTEPGPVIERRLATAREELACMDEFDVVVVNDKVADAAEELVNLIGLGPVSGHNQDEKDIHT